MNSPYPLQEKPVSPRPRDLLPVTIEPAALDRLMPMHLLVALSGEILRMGPGLSKVLGKRTTSRGAHLFDLFVFRRPADASTVAQLLGIEDGPLRLAPRFGLKRSMKGLAIPLANGAGAIINLSFGISVIDAVRDLDLTAGDFAVTDLAVEMLYLMEAKSAALEESRRLNTRLQGAKLVAEEQAFTDTLTGLRNRRAMDVVLERLLATHERFGLMHLDLDRFKAVNDTYGHAAGDEVLATVAQRLLAQTRVADTVARVGGDEFVLIFLGLESTARLSEVANRIIHCLELPISFGQAALGISASIGITATSKYDSPDAEAMQRDADNALYVSKRAGRGRYSHFAMPEDAETGIGLRRTGALHGTLSCATAVAEQDTGRTIPDDRF